MSQYPQFNDAKGNIYGFMHGLSLLSNMFKQMTWLSFSPEFEMYSFVNLICTDILENTPLKELAEVVSSFDQNKYEKLIRLIQKLSTTSNPLEIEGIVMNLERAFNFSRLVIKDPLKQLKIENMQWDLINIKKVIGMLTLRPHDKELKKTLESLFDEILSKLESSKYTHDFLRSIGTDENELMSEYKRIKREDGSVDYVWIKS